MSASRSPTRVLRWLCLGLAWLLALAAALTLIRAEFGGVQIGMLSFAGALALLGLLAPRVGPRATVAGCAILLPLLGVFAWSPSWAVFQIWSRIHGERPLKLHTPDQRYCYRQIPGASAEHETPDFRVTYHIDAAGLRVTPTPDRPRGNVVILGCSFTFGHGVQDHEAYPYLLGQRHWPRHKVENHGVMGWGTAHALVRLQEVLQRRPPPRLVIYGWIRDHFHRGYWGKHCLTPASVGMRPAEPGDPQHLGESMIKEGLSLIEQMQARCKARGVPLVVALLSSRTFESMDPAEVGERSPERELLTDSLRRSGVPYLDLTRVAAGDHYPNDRHPTASWHVAIARELAGAPVIQRLMGRQ